MYTRAIDIDGYAISPPAEYYDLIEAGEKLVEKMEAENTDRSDMRVMLDMAFSEIVFRLVMLPKREASK